MKQPLVLFALALMFFSCNNKEPPNLLSPNNLRSHFVTLNSDSGYVLTTPKGARLVILPNSFNAPAGSEIRIEIKEAYSMQDILLAGLTTESDRKPLKSAGMVYFGARVNSRTISFLKPIQVTIPSRIYDSAMQVFKGEIKSDSTINWINPQSLDTSPAVKNLLYGKDLFNAMCANCHKPSKDFIGPALAGARKRAPSPDWAYKFVNNVKSMREYDQYAQYLISKYGSVMTQFNLKISEIKAILDYCDNQVLAFSNERLDSTLFSKTLFKTNCGYDTFYFPKEKIDIEIVPFNGTLSDSIGTLNTNSLDSSNATDSLNVTKEEEAFTKAGYNQVAPESGMYQFNILESGWYNIDVLFNELGATTVKLLAEIKTEANIVMTVYLCIPKRKILVNAGKHKNNSYLFNYSDANGYLPLVLNDDAIVFATASSKDKIYYGITKFKVIKDQTILVEIKESTKEEVLQAFKVNRLDGIKLDVEKKEMEILEKSCDGNPIETPRPVSRDMLN